MISGSLLPQTAVLLLAVGLLFSLVCYLVTNLSPGGMITPGWISLAIFDDYRKAAMIVGVTAATFLGMKLLQPWVILYGKRLFAAVVMLGVLLSTSLFLAVQHDYPLLFVHQTLGFVIPGLIAYQLLRQPPKATLLATASVSLATYGVVASGVLLGLVPTL
jgi:poly-gamma-glutamate biosynthesis protein PgsC/CapC